MKKPKAPKTPYESPLKAFRQPLVTTVYRCPHCRHTTMHNGKVWEKGCRWCDKATQTEADIDQFASHPTPHGARRAE
jgi:phage terminase large subunit GpA-like protein